MMSLNRLDIVDINFNMDKTCLLRIEVKFQTNFDFLCYLEGVHDDKWGLVSHVFWYLQILEEILFLTLDHYHKWFDLFYW